MPLKKLDSDIHDFVSNPSDFSIDKALYTDAFGLKKKRVELLDVLGRLRAAIQVNDTSGSFEDKSEGRRIFF